MNLNLQFEERSLDQLQLLAGAQDSHLLVLSKTFSAPVLMRGSRLTVLDLDPALEDAFMQAVEAMWSVIDERMELTDQDAAYICTMAKAGKLSGFSPEAMQPVARTKSGKLIYPRTLGQAQLVQALRKNDMVFAAGPAGTGKTYLAVAWAVQLLQSGQITRIILTRPAVEAGESLGFLPGDLKEKVDPYLRPLYDSLNDLLGQDGVEKLLEKGVIEIAPLAFMRGRTLNNAAVILDEAQNTTSMQMKMFLTRMGRQTKMIITGDVTQIDLPKRQESGLVQAWNLLADLDGIARVQLDNRDVVRNPLVSKILERYASVES